LLRNLLGYFIMKIKYVIAVLIICLFANAFAQGEAKKLAVYVSGTSNAGIGKSLENKLLAAFVQSGSYAEIANAEAFQSEVAKGSGMDWVAQAARQQGADFVCVVNIAEAFGVYSVFARIVDVASSQAVKTASADSPLKSMEDLTTVSDELAKQLFQDSSPPPAAVADDVAPKQCDKTYNINEFLFKVKDGFPAQLKDCSSKLAKDMLTPASFGGHKLEPMSFMKQCPIDGIKKELPEGFPGVDKFIVSLTNFVQGIMNTASAGGTLDPKKLVSTIGSMDINGLLDEARNLASMGCVVDEPYEPPAKQEHADAEEGGAKDKRSVYFGIRGGFNFSHIYIDNHDNYYGTRSGSYKSIGGMQLGVVLDIAATDWFYIQPGLMYIQKGMQDINGKSTSHNIDVLALLSIKASVLRLNAGPYLSFCMSGNDYICKTDVGLSAGFGFDIDMFYLGMFYDYGLSALNSSETNNGHFETYSRTLGFNFGVNL